MKLFTQDATFYAEQIKLGNLSSKELVKQAIDNIKELDEKFNAVTNLFEESLIEATNMDNYLQNTTDKNSLPPFYGVPILVKDLGQSQANVTSSSGSKLLAGNVSLADSNFIKKLKEAGFIIVGRTNVPEFGFKNISDSEFLGRVNSPLDLNRNPGGSSGGAAVSLNAGYVPIATASDGGGSIRIPASFSGLIGLKPTRGRVPVGPGSYRGWQGASIEFALTKSVRDTWNFLKAVQVEQLESPFLMPTIKEETLEPLERKLNIAYTLESPIKSEVSDDAKQAVLTTVEYLRELGHELVEDTIEIDGVRAMETYYMVNGVETALMIKGIESAIGREVTAEDIEAMSWAIYQYGYSVSGMDYSSVLAYWDKIAAVSESFLKEYDLYLMPTTNGIAPKHGQFALEEEFVEKLRTAQNYSKEEQAKLVWDMFADSLAWTPFTQQANLTGQPAISLPIYRSKEENLPLGVQFTAGKSKEYLLLQIAAQLEEANKLNIELIEA